MPPSRLKVRFRYLVCPSQPETPTRKQKSKYDFFFDRDQQWSDPRIDPEFWDETEDIYDAYAGEPPALMTPALSTTPANPAKSVHPSLSPPEHHALNGNDAAHRTQDVGHSSGWPFQSDEEAFLFRHFQRVVLPWIGASDKDQCFRRFVQRNIHLSPMLLYAVCALSARHLWRTAAYSALSPLVYQEKCLSLLLPTLERSNIAKDETVLATTCTLRIYEELDSASPTEDEQRHLVGLSLLLMGPKFELSAPVGSLKHTVIWCQLRQEMYPSFALQQPMRINLDDLIFEPDKYCTCDITWANRLIWHAADVQRWAFTHHGRSIEEFQRLSEIFESWEERWPPSFRPTFRREIDAEGDRHWPDIWFAEIEHAGTAMHAIMAKIVLLMYDPRKPQMGPQAKHATANIKTKLSASVRELCGIALSNDYEPLWNGSCIVISTCAGDWITDLNERLACIQFLEIAEPKSGWPTQAIVRRLKAEWDL